MENPPLGVNVKTVLILGNFSLESVEDKIFALGHKFQKINPFEETLTLASTEKELNRLRTSGELLAVLVFLTEALLLHSCGSEYEETWQNLLQEIKQTASLVFVSEDNLLGKFSCEEPVSITRAEAEETLTEQRKREERPLFHEQLKRERLLRGWSQMELAARLSFSSSTVGRWERGHSFPTLYIQPMLIELFGKSAEELGLTNEHSIDGKVSSVEETLTEQRKREERPLFHEQLKRERLLRGWSQMELAARLSFSSSTVGRWERGHSLPTLYIQPMLIELFGKSAEELGLTNEHSIDGKVSSVKYTLDETQSRKGAEEVLAQLPLIEQVPKAELLLKNIQASGVELAPYRRDKEISIRCHHFLDEVDRGIFLHLYVPNGRYQEEQLASFLRLFESYLQRVEKISFFIDIRRTSHGKIYEFKSRNTAIISLEMGVAISRFESFMSLCQNDQKKAEALLLRAGMNPSEASRLTTKYVKEYQRLLLDIEHERERKTLDLQQRLESEAFELTHDTTLAVPQSVQPTALLSLPNNLDPLSITISHSSVTINPGIQSYVEQAIYGDIHYTTEDRELLHLFERYAEQLEAIRLRSDLEQLKDISSSDMERKTAKQKIVGFLGKVAPAVGQSALTVLTAYLEKVLTGS